MSPSGYGTAAWSATRAAALLRAGHRCERCGGRPSRLYVHHVDERGPTGPKGYDLDNVVVLCPPCHNGAHGRHGRPVG